MTLTSVPNVPVVITVISLEGDTIFQIHHWSHFSPTLPLFATGIGGFRSARLAQEAEGAGN
jgi:hypothetical protein